MAVISFPNGNITSAVVSILAWYYSCVPFNIFAPFGHSLARFFVQAILFAASLSGLIWPYCSWYLIYATCQWVHSSSLALKQGIVPVLTDVCFPIIERDCENCMLWGCISAYSEMWAKRISITVEDKQFMDVIYLVHWSPFMLLIELSLAVFS